MTEALLTEDAKLSKISKISKNSTRLELTRAENRKTREHQNFLKSKKRIKRPQKTRENVSWLKKQQINEEEGEIMDLT